MKLLDFLNIHLGLVNNDYRQGFSSGHSVKLLINKNYFLNPVLPLLKGTFKKEDDEMLNLQMKFELNSIFIAIDLNIVNLLQTRWQK